MGTPRITNYYQQPLPIRPPPSFSDADWAKALAKDPTQKAALLLGKAINDQLDNIQWQYSLNAVRSDVCDVGLNDRGQDPTRYAAKPKWHNQAERIVACEYEPFLIDTTRQYDRFFRDSPGLKNVSGPESMMTRVCKSRHDGNEVPRACPAGYDKCFRMNADTPTGVACRRWFAAKPTSERTAMQKELCRKYPRNRECACINRSLDKDYLAMKPHTVFPDHCWYTPCGVGAPYTFVPKELTDQKCPENVCTVHFENQAKRNIDFRNNVTIIKCDSQKDSSSSGSSREEETAIKQAGERREAAKRAATEKKNKKGQENDFGQYWPLILGLFSVAIVFVLVLKFKQK